MELIQLIKMTVTEHQILAQQLETRYQQHIADLMAEKAAHHQRLQMNLCNTLNELSISIQNNTSIITTRINHHNDTDSLFSSSFVDLAESMSISGDTNMSNMEYIMPTLETDDTTTTSSETGKLSMDIPTLLTSNKILNDKDLNMTQTKEYDGIENKLSNACQRYIKENGSNEFNINDIIDNKENNNNNTSLAETFKAKGNELFKQKNYQKAKDEYSKAIELNSKNAIYYFNRASVCTRLKQFQQVLKDSYV